jgi:hypothetical protein
MPAPSVSSPIASAIGSAAPASNAIPIAAAAASVTTGLTHGLRRYGAGRAAVDIGAGAGSSSTYRPSGSSSVHTDSLAAAGSALTVALSCGRSCGRSWGLCVAEDAGPAGYDGPAGGAVPAGVAVPA